MLAPPARRRIGPGRADAPHHAPDRASPVHNDRQDFTIYSGDWATGRIYQQRGGPESMRWFWALYGMVWHRARLVNLETDWLAGAGGLELVSVAFSIRRRPAEIQWA